MELWMLSYFLNLVDGFRVVDKFKGNSGVCWVSEIITFSQLVTESETNFVS